MKSLFSIILNFLSPHFNLLHKWHQKITNKLFPHLKPWDIKTQLIADNKKFNDKIKNVNSVGNGFLSKSISEPGTIPAGYTYFGQFIAHDLSFPSKRFLYQKHFGRFGKFSSIIPKLDLQSVYGAGPELDPVFYDQSKFFGRTHFRVPYRLVKTSNSSNKNCLAPDLNRNKYNKKAIALIPDSRNDENIVISQLHVAFQLAHNKFINKELCNLENQKIVKYCKKKEEISKTFNLEITSISNHTNSQNKEFKIKKKNILTESNTKFDDAIRKGEMFISESFKNIPESGFTENEGFSILNNFKNGLSDRIERLGQNNPTIKETENGIIGDKVLDFILFFEEEKLRTIQKYEEEKEEKVKDFETLLDKLLNQEEATFFKTLDIGIGLASDRIDSEAILIFDCVFYNSQKKLQRLFHWLILIDFLPTMLKGFPNDLDENIKNMKSFKAKVFRSPKELFLPLEFIIAFFRFGHSMVARSYLINKISTSSASIFSFKKLNQQIKIYLDWSMFFPKCPNDLHNPSNKINTKIDTSMLRNLGIDNDSSKNIVFRNLERSRIAKLPSGQRIARLLIKKGIIEKSKLDQILNLEIQQKNELLTFLIDGFKTTNPNLGAQTRQIKKTLSLFIDDSPLWFYVLMESEICSQGLHLGPVSGLIVKEVLFEIIKNEPNSILKNSKNDQIEINKENSQLGIKNIRDFLIFAGVYKENPCQ